MRLSEIHLTKGKTALVDPEDLQLLSCSKWQFHPGGYAARSRLDGEPFMHRLLACARNGEEVDHINGNRLDNRRANLRITTRAQNARNQRVRSDNTSGFKGVRALGARWRSEIRVAGRKLHLGVFDRAEDAAKAYDRAAIEHFGEHAATNAALRGAS